MIKRAFFALPFALFCCSAFAQTAVQSGSWSDPATFGGTIPFINDVSDVATIPAGITVEIPDGFGVQAEFGTIRIQGRLNVIGSLLVTSGRIENSGILGIAVDATLEIEELDAFFSNSGTVFNFGSFEPGIWSEVRNSGTFWNFGTFDHGPRCEFTNLASGTFNNGGLYELGNFSVTMNYGEIINQDTINMWWVDVVGLANSPVISNQGGTVYNAENGSMQIQGRIFNSEYLGQTGLVENRGSIVLDELYFSNRGTGPAVIDNYGTIDNQGSRLETATDNQGDNSRIINRPGGLIQGSIWVQGGSLDNLNGGTVEIPTGEKLEVDEDGRVDNDSEINNEGAIVNAGTVANRCNGFISGSAGTYSGNSVQDWCDATPPVVAPSVTGTPGNNSWYVSNVGVSWSVTDPETPILLKSGCAPSSVSTDTAGITFECIATSPGGTTSTGILIKRDATRPTATFSVLPEANNDGWNNQDVTVSFTGQDARSGIASCSSPVVLSVDGAGQGASGTCTDNAGNVSLQASATGINIDKTPPVIEFIGNAGSYTAADFINITCEAEDVLSGLESSSCPSASGFGYEFDLEASNVLNASASDLAGNESENSTSFEVTVSVASIQQVTGQFIADSFVVKKIGKALDDIAAEQKPAKKEKSIKELQTYLQKLVEKGTLSAADHQVLLMLLELQFG